VPRLQYSLGEPLELVRETTARRFRNHVECVVVQGVAQ
jgi:hypothetical protein